MKAERRHALQTNTLSTKLVALPDFGKKYGRRAALAIGVLIIIGLFFYKRYSARAEARANMLDILTESREIDNNFAPPPYGTRVPADARKALTRLKFLTDESNGDSDQRVQAYWMIGDLNWSLFKYPTDNPNAPEEQRVITPREELLKNASDAYHYVLDHAGNDIAAATAARFGLAAIAEDQAPYATNPADRWKEAEEYYTQISKGPGVPSSLARLANDRLAALDAEKWQAVKDFYESLKNSTDTFVAMQGAVKLQQLEQLQNLKSLPVLTAVEPEIRIFNFNNPMPGGPTTQRVPFRDVPPYQAPRNTTQPTSQPGAAVDGFLDNFAIQSDLPMGPIDPDMLKQMERMAGSSEVTQAVFVAPATQPSRLAELP